MLRDLEVAEHAALTGQAKARIAIVRGKSETPILGIRWLRNLAIDPDGAGSARTASATIECLRRTVVEGEPGSNQNHAEIRTMRTLDRLPFEVNHRHSIRVLPIRV